MPLVLVWSIRNTAAYLKPYTFKQNYNEKRPCTWKRDLHNKNRVVWCRFRQPFDEWISSSSLLRLPLLHSSLHRIDNHLTSGLVHLPYSVFYCCTIVAQNQKQARVYEKGPISETYGWITMPLVLVWSTHVYEKGPTKETCIYEKRPSKETYWWVLTPLVLVWSIIDTAAYVYVCIYIYIDIYLSIYIYLYIYICIYI